MTLIEIINGINGIALKQPAIKEVIKSGNIYDLSESRNAKFSVFCTTQGTHTSNVKDGYTTYNFFLYYVDRLQSDESNKLEIQSTGMEVLKNVIRVFQRDFDVEIDSADYQVFTERFSELCAGVYATVSIIAYDENCIEDYE